MQGSIKGDELNPFPLIATMGYLKSAVFCAALVAVTSALNHVTPWDKEVVYHWNALVKAGTDLPTPHASQFSLHGKVHVQANNNATHIQIKDLTYKLYNGHLDHLHEHEAHSVPVQVPELHHPFKVVHDGNGLAIGIVTNNQDKHFSVNIKKAIATILQMHDSVLKPVHQQHGHHHSFVVKEHSIYGQFDVDYTVHHHKNGDVEIDKLHDMHDDSHHLYQHLVSNNEELPCDMDYENPLLHESKKHYKIVKHEGHHVVQEIWATGGLIYQPFRSQSDHQFVHVNQTLILDQIVPIQQQIHVENEHFTDHLTYHVGESHDEETHDLTNGRHVVDYDKHIPKIQHMLQDIHQYLHENHIHTQEPDSEHGQLINRVQRLLQKFPLAKLHELQKKLSHDELHIFHHILPLVGTKASVRLITHLVTNKVVDEKVAVEMLQHFPEHVIEPTVEFLTQVEDLIRLDQNVHWHVRKTAILSFATLVGRSHHFVKKVQDNMEHEVHSQHTEHRHQDHAEHQDHVKHQQDYEKYVVEYINKMRSSNEYRVQMAYAYGLSNMRLRSIIQHLLPAVHGEWINDYHFKMLSLWAVGSSVLVDPNPNTVIETLWPLFTDVDEITELRLLAFYFLVESKVSQSRLINMYEHLLHEPNQEVYSFVYHYLHDLVHSKEPCNEHYRVKVAHLVQLLPPPTHGNSFVHVHDFRDNQFGYSGGVQEIFANGHHSVIFGYKSTSQNFHIHHEDYAVLVKVHGVQKHGDPVNMLIDLFRKKTPNTITNSNNVHIECAILRHGHVISVYFFDQQNLHELDHILDLFTKDSQSLTQQFLHVSYDEHHEALIPSDLGFPVVWQYKMPVVHHNNISINKETVNKVSKVHIDARFVNWVHYRHGLSFYNPIIDVWQGINRYHSHDEVWPLRLDVTLNTQQQSLQLSWRKHHDHHNNVGGIRSHVKQMTFVKDDHSRNVLSQSSPQCKEFVVVSHGKQFRNDYVLVHEDDLTTGHRWFVGAYDSSHYVSNGSFHHHLHRFSESHAQEHESLLTHLVLSYIHWHQHLRLMPSAGTHGFIVKVEPSHQHDVTNIDLSLRHHSEPATDDSFFYSPKVKWSTRATYSVKNEEKSLKTWDINTILDMNPGHTVNNLKMYLTRIVPGLKDYKICVEGVKKWADKGVEGHLNVAMSQSPDGKCVKDDTVIDVTMTGHHSNEQVDGRHKYGSCERINPYSVPHTHSLQCLVDHSTVRRYVYNVKTTNVPTEFRKNLAQWWDSIKGHYVSYYTFEDEHNENIGDHNLRVDVEYPVQVDQVGVHVTTPQHVYRLTGVPTHHWHWLGLHPDSLEYPQWFQYLHHIGFVDHCEVEVDHYHLNEREVREQVPNEWTLYVGNAAQTPEKAVYVKAVDEGRIGVKIVDHEHTVEIVPHGANHQITLDGKVVPVKEYHHEDWVYCHQFTQDTHHPVALVLQRSGLHVEYHHHQVVVVVPKVDQQLHGKCYSHH